MEENISLFLDKTIPGYRINLDGVHKFTWDVDGWVILTAEGKFFAYAAGETLDGVDSVYVYDDEEGARENLDDSTNVNATPVAFAAAFCKFLDIKSST